MGMPRGSRWKRLAVFSDEINSDSADVLLRHLRGHGIAEYEWWTRTVPRGQGKYHADNPVNNLMRDVSPTNESWLMVRKGDWPLAYILAKDCGLVLEFRTPTSGELQTRKGM